MGKLKDLTGNKYGKLEPEYYDTEKKKWLCKCDCGNTHYVKSRLLTTGQVKSCGCSNKSSSRDLTGDRFGNLIVLNRLEERRNTKVQWLCRCDCGNELKVTTQHLTRGSVTSCGCKKYRNLLRNDITGKRYGSLTAIRHIGKSIWELRCDCGNMTIGNLSSLKNGKKIYCEECHKNYKDISGKKFGKLTAIRYLYSKDSRAIWLWLCDCGNEIEHSSHDILQGKTTSCGCLNIAVSGSKAELEIKYYIEELLEERKAIMAGKAKDLVGMKFGELEVIKRAENRGDRRAYWLCRCSCGNEIEVTTYNLTSGHSTTCGHKKDLVGKQFSYLTVEEEIESTTKGQRMFRCKCKCGNYTNVTYSHLVNNHTKSCGCYKSAPKERKNHKPIGFRADLTDKKFGELTVISYNYDTKAWLCKCSCGNYKEVNTALLNNGHITSCGCAKYCGNHKVDRVGQRFGRLVVLHENGTKNGNILWHCKCSCGNECDVTSKCLVTGDTKSCGCLGTAHGGSYDELQIKDYISSLTDVEITKEKVLDGKEIDIYLKELGIGIEYNGSKFHATLNGVYDNKPLKYHQEKFLIAKEKGIHLIHIFDVDWENNQDKIKNYLRSIIVPQEKIFARKCEVRRVEKVEARDFFNQFHLYGNSTAGLICYGLYYNDELMSCMSFGKLRLAKTEEGQFELHRYVIRDGYNVVGGAQKILKAFEKDFNPKYILSFSYNDYFWGGIYERLGFENSGQSHPRYYWNLNGYEIKRERCQLKRLRNDFPELLQEAYDVGAPNKEDYVMISLGACKVYRSGNTKWEKYYE